MTNLSYLCWLTDQEIQAGFPAYNRRVQRELAKIRRER